MAVKKINLDNIEKTDLDEIAAFLQNGGVIAYPTDTIYGLGCLATARKSINLIKKIKQRPKQKGFIVLVGSLAMAKKYAVIGQIRERFLKKIWPGPYTIVLPGNHKLPQVLEGQEGGLAMRCPANDFLIKVISRVKIPLVSTSINISGGQILTQPKEIADFLKPLARAVLFVNAGKLKKQKPSTIIDMRDINRIKILRN